MPRGRARASVHYRSNPPLMRSGIWRARKVLTDTGGLAYESDVAKDDFGNTYNARTQTGDVDYDAGRGGHRGR